MTVRTPLKLNTYTCFSACLKQLESTLDPTDGDARCPAVTVRSFQQFLYELIRQTTIPFTSEGDSRVQLMGLLETRTLDFERVIILSANEGVLPVAPDELADPL